jgi:hypothetical protein
MKVAIVGSRGFHDYEMLKREVLAKVDISKVTEIISGGAIGADFLAEKFGQEHNIKVTIFKPDWSTGRGAGIIRNKTIVESSDVVFAFWDGESKGTKSSIGLADRLEKQVFVSLVKGNVRDKLELWHIAGYLPYELLIQVRFETYTREHILEGTFLSWSLKNITPVLRPMSDLTKEITVNGETFIPFIKVGIYLNVEHLIEEVITGMCPVIVFNMLLKWHFDVYGLIAKGLAININDTQK